MTDLYPLYINNYDTASAKYQNLMEKNKKFNQLLESISKSEGDFPSYLILPVQMIPRYSLLLKDIIKYTPIDHIDCEDLKKGLENILKIGGDINEKKRDNENQKYIDDLKNRLGDDYKIIEKKHRKLLKTGNVTIKTPIQKLRLDGDYELYLYSDILLLTYLIQRDQYNNIKENQNLKWFQIINLSFATCDFDCKIKL
jgi:hypothetical protein